MCKISHLSRRRSRPASAGFRRESAVAQLSTLGDFAHEHKNTSNHIFGARGYFYRV